MVFGMGPLELMIILGIALLIFGPKNLPKLGKSLGQTVKNVREGMEGDEEEEPKKVEAAAEPTPAPEPVVAEPVVETVAAVADEAEEDVVFCGECGAKNPASSSFCSKCGSKLA